MSLSTKSTGPHTFISISNQEMVQKIQPATRSPTSRTTSELWYFHLIMPFVSRIAIVVMITKVIKTKPFYEDWMSVVEISTSPGCIVWHQSDSLISPAQWECALPLSNRSQLRERAVSLERKQIFICKAGRNRITEFHAISLFYFCCPYYILNS